MFLVSEESELLLLFSELVFEFVLFAKEVFHHAGEMSDFFIVTFGRHLRFREGMLLGDWVLGLRVVGHGHESADRLAVVHHLRGCLRWCATD